MTAPPFTLPPDALEKSAEKAKTQDAYAELTPEERAEEGLPPPEKPAAAPAAPVAPAAPAAPVVEPEPVAEPTDEDDRMEEFFENIASIREDLASALGGPEPAAEHPKDDPLLKAAQEHEDPVVRELAARLEDQKRQLEAMQSTARTERVSQQLKQDNADFSALSSTFVIAGKPVTQEHIDATETWMLQNPEVARRLPIETCFRIVHPDAVKGTAAAPAAPVSKPGKPAEGPPAATIVTPETPGGAPAQPWKPGPNDNIETAMKAASQNVFGLKR